MRGIGGTVVQERFYLSLNQLFVYIILQTNAVQASSFRVSDSYSVKILQQFGLHSLFGQENLT
jgi:hypothetical protein